jgi:prepilin-type processing-associated H-X9-DG protein
MFKMNDIQNTSRMMGFSETTSADGYSPGQSGVTPKPPSGVITSIGDAALFCNPNGQAYNAYAGELAANPSGVPGASGNLAIFHMPNRVNAGFMDGHAETLICTPYALSTGSATGIMAPSLHRLYAQGAGFVLTPYQP